MSHGAGFSLDQTETEWGEFALALPALFLFHRMP